MKTSAMGLALIVSAACCGAERVEQPEAWKLIPVCGKTFYNGATGIAVPWMRQLWENYKDEPMYENMWLELGGFRWTANDIQTKRLYDENRDVVGNELVKLAPPASPLEKPPLTIENLLRRRGYDKLIDEFLAKKPGSPITLGCGVRPVWPLKDSFDCDVAGFDKWCEKYPTFSGFLAFDEVDNDTGGIKKGWQRDSYKNPEDRAWIDKAYPTSDWPNADFTPWMDTLYRKAQAYHFGTDKLEALWANGPSWAFNLARKNMKVLWYEAEMQSVGAPWRWGGMYVRGAARQFHTPFGWYTAAYSMRQYKKGGIPPTRKETADGVPVPRWPCLANRNPVLYTGAARTLMKRNVFYGSAIGAVSINLEGGGGYLSGFDPVETNKVVLSPYGEDYRDIFRWHKQHDRGVVYTPVAFLVSTDEVMTRQGRTGENHDVFSIMAFLTTLNCPHMDNLYCSEPENGNQGQMFNGEFGEFVDMLSPDAGQKSADFYNVLKCYKAAILVGWFEGKRFDRDALVKYVKEGGIVYAENRHVEMGLIPESVPGAKGRIVLTDTFLDPKVTDGKGHWFSDKMSGLFKGTITNPKIENLLRELQDKYMPVKVEGDIQWGVNLVVPRTAAASAAALDGGCGRGGRTTEEGHWLVWLINNKGVKKWMFEPDEIDLSKTATVKVTDKKTGKVYTATVKPGDYAAVEIPFE